MWLTRPPRRMFLSTRPTDLRKSYDGLGAMVEGFRPGGAMSGDLFIFINRKRTQVRMIFFDGTGYCIFMKRLESGTFRDVFRTGDDGHLEVDHADLAMLLEGVDAEVVTRRKRYHRLLNRSE